MTVTEPDPQLEDFLLELGRYQLAAGYPVNDVSATLNTVARAYGRPDVTTYVLPNAVMLDDPVAGRARLVPEGSDPLRLDQAATLHDIAQEARRGTLDLSTGLAELAALPAQESRYPLWLSILGYGIASSGFALVFRVSPWGVAMAALLGLFVGWLVIFTRHRPAVAPLVPPFAAMVCSFIVFGFANLIDANVSPLRVAIAPIITLIPGTALTRATQELSAGHVIAGASRLVAAIVQILVLLFGILVGTMLAHVSPYDLGDVTEARLPFWVAWIGAIIYAFGQALAFSEPKGAVRWVIPLLLVAFSIQQVVAWRLDSVVAAGLAAMVALFLALVIQERTTNGPPAFVLFAPVFWLLVPGSLGLVGLVETITGADSDAASSGAALPDAPSAIPDAALTADSNVLVIAGASIIAITIGMQIASVAGRLVRERSDSPSPRT